MIQRQGIYVIDIDKDGKEVKTSITSVEQFDKHIRKTQGNITRNITYWFILVLRFKNYVHRLAARSLMFGGMKLFI